MNSIFWLSMICAGRGQTAPAAAIEWRKVTPAISDAVLFNPGMGLSLAGGSGLGYQPGPDAWVLSLANIVYFRPTWNDLEADGPEAGFDAYFEPIFDFWVRQRGTWACTWRDAGHRHSWSRPDLPGTGTSPPIAG